MSRPKCSPSFIKGDNLEDGNITDKFSMAGNYFLLLTLWFSKTLVAALNIKLEVNDDP